MVLFNGYTQYIINIVSYQYCMHYRYRLVFLICMFPPVAMDCIIRYVLSLRVFKQMDAHVCVLHIHTRARIHSFFLTLAVKQCFLTIKYSPILRVMGMRRGGPYY